MLYIWFWAKVIPPRNTTKTKHALQLQRKGPPLISLPSPSPGITMLLLESGIMFSHLSPSPGQVPVALAGVRTWVFPAAPAASGRVLRAQMAPSGCPAGLVLPVKVGLWWCPPPWLHRSSCGSPRLPRQESIWERWGKPLPPFWCSLAVQPFPSNTFSTKQF